MKYSSIRGLDTRGTRAPAWELFEKKNYLLKYIFNFSVK